MAAGSQENKIREREENKSECNDVTGVITALPTVTVTLTLVQTGASHWLPGHEEGL